MNEKLQKEMRDFADKRHEDLKVIIKYSKGNSYAKVHIGDNSDCGLASTINAAVDEAYSHVKRGIRRRE